jgi:RimJ/RimL family protein N-acetyltransferase
MIELREVLASDLPIIFEQQRDPEANRMAAFTSRDPNDRNAFQAHWDKILADPEIIKRTIWVDGKIAGNIGSFLMFGEREVGYWIGKEYWGKGIASQALALFLKVVNLRPLHARAAKDNFASIRTLEKNGFQLTGHEKAFAKARNEEIEEVIFILK